MTEILVGLRGLVLWSLCTATWAEADHLGRQFIGLEDFTSFRLELRQGDEVTLTSPVITPAILWDELVVSWNVELPASSRLEVEARALYPDRATKFYSLGVWSCHAQAPARHSVSGQQDADGNVLTDILTLAHPGQRLQVRLTLGPLEPRSRPRLKLLGLSVVDTRVGPSALRSDQATWGKVIAVPERSQMSYDGGQAWCSPSSLSMLLAYWSRRLNRPELDVGVPEVARNIHDPNWPGTGNWPFNTAYAGSFPGLRAYVTRFGDLTQLEQWIALGIPVVASVSYSALKGGPDQDNGHLVVCVGFAANGDVTVNDPGTSQGVRRTFPRANFVSAWAHSRNTVYLIYPEGTATPPDRFGHWYSCIP